MSRVLTPDDIAAAVDRFYCERSERGFVRNGHGTLTPSDHDAAQRRAYVADLVERLGQPDDFAPAGRALSRLARTLNLPGSPAADPAPAKGDDDRPDATLPPVNVADSDDGGPW